MSIRDHLLLADDMVSNRIFLSKLFEDEFVLLEAEDGAQTLDIIAKYHDKIAAVLLDLIMPIKDGYQVLAEMRERGYLDEIPVIVVTSDSSQKSEAKVLSLGALDLVAKPYDPYIIRRRVQNLVNLKRSQDQLAVQVGALSAAMDMTNDTVVNTLATITEFRSLESGQHILRIRTFTKILLEEVARSFPEYELDEKKIATISSASVLHDIGKISIPDAILNKPGKLTQEEFEVMKTHTTAGCEILDSMTQVVDRDYMRYAYNICRYHHERWDGRGYPDGLKGENIPICAQVVGIADVYDALTTKRVYKGAIAHEETVNMILNGECGVFSPHLLECFKRVRMDFSTCARAYADGSLTSSEDLHVPLPQPKAITAGINTQQMATIKYHTLLGYVNGVVVEVDMDLNSYHLVYDSSKIFADRHNDGSFDDFIQQLSQHIVHPRDSAYAKKGIDYLRHGFFEEGLRRYTQKFRVRTTIDADAYMWIESTFLRLDTGNPSLRKCIIIWKKIANTPAAGRFHKPDLPPGWNDQIQELVGLTLRCRNDRQHTIVDGSDRLATLLGYRPEELQAVCQNQFMAIVLPEDREALISHVHKQLSETSTVAVEYRLQGKNGRITWAKDRACVFLGEDGMEYVYHAIVDNSDFRETMEQLLSIQERHHILLDQIDDIALEWDVGRDSAVFSPNFKKQLGYEPVPTGFSQRILDGSIGIHPDDLPFFQDLTHAICSGSDFPSHLTVDFRLRKADDTYVWRRLRASVQQMENGKTECVIGALIDMDAGKLSLSDSQNRHEQDGLTKLFNRQAAIQRAKDLLEGRRSGEHVALLLIDLDHFCDINRQYGRMAGDAALVQCARILQNFFRRGDLIARIGGDEFLVLVRSVTSDSFLLAQCQHFAKAVTDQMAKELPESPLSCSIGIALAPGDGNTYDKLFRNAVHALFSAKTGQDGNVCFFHPNKPAPSYSLATTPIESDELPNLPEQSLVFHTLDHLPDSGSPDEAIGSVLDLVGRQMHVSRAFLMETDENGLCRKTFEWCDKGIQPYRTPLKRLGHKTALPPDFPTYPGQTVFLCENVDALPEKPRTILKLHSIKSMLLCAIQDNNILRGYVGVDECTEDRTWTREQVDALSMVAKMSAMLLLKRHEQEAGGQRKSD